MLGPHGGTARVLCGIADGPLEPIRLSINPPISQPSSHTMHLSIQYADCSDSLSLARNRATSRHGLRRGQVRTALPNQPARLLQRERSQVLHYAPHNTVMGAATLQLLTNNKKIATYPPHTSATQFCYTFATYFFYTLLLYTFAAHFCYTLLLHTTFATQYFCYTPLLLHTTFATHHLCYTHF